MLKRFKGELSERCIEERSALGGEINPDVEREVEFPFWDLGDRRRDRACHGAQQWP